MSTGIEAPSTTAGFIGFGDIGGPMAERLVRSRRDTVLWSRRPESLQQFDGLDFRRAASISELAASVDAVGVCVSRDDDVREVVAGDGGLVTGLRAGSVIAIHSTVAAATVIDLSRQAAERGILLLDAPISGARQGAVDGTLTIMAGGSSEAIDRARPMLEAYATTICQVGDVGAGQRAKLLNNTLLAANLYLADAALTLGEQLGLDRDACAQVLRSSSADSFALRILIDRFSVDQEFARHAAAIRKDNVRLFREMCAELGIAATDLERAAAEAHQVAEKYGRGRSAPPG
ncbi:MAG: NAD(P)-dependent oxidoreductase [Cryobacterium sp.]|nr:NAD(P)-dependent oxidoreductase [Cryobacterium sp.]